MNSTQREAFYITTTLPYVNAAPHIGFAWEIVLADVRARMERAEGRDVVFNTGTDEHGAKIYEKAQEAKVPPQDYVDQYAKTFRELETLLNVSPTQFIRTTDAYHKAAAQELWRRVDANGYIYKKTYYTKYCIGCELEKTDSELDHGRCPFHPDRPLQEGEEENYFFRFSAFQEPLLELYNRYTDFVVPQKRLNEVRSFVERGLQDFSISRLRRKVPWGVPVPGDDEHVMYVWFDALTNYISTLHWPDDEDRFVRFWGTPTEPRAIQIAGKDNLRQQSAMWQAMLLAAGLPPSRQVFINGFISVDGQKMSKSLGNVISPSEMVERYGVDGTRYVLLTLSAFGDDSDLSWDRMDATYTADLVNGLGNLVRRIAALTPEGMTPSDGSARIAEMKARIIPLVRRMEMREALAVIWEMVNEMNTRMEQQAPWTLRKTDPEAYQTVMQSFVDDVAVLGTVIRPFLPQTAEAIIQRQNTLLFERCS